MPTYLTDLTTVKTSLKINVADDDARITLLLPAVTKWVQNYTRRILISGTVTDLKDGFGADSVVLRDYPVTAVSKVYSSVTVPRVYDATTEVAVDTGYVTDLSSGIVKRVDGGFFGCGPQTVKIAYTAGYATVPEDLARAAIEVIAIKLVKGKTQSYHLAGESRGDGSVTYTADTVSRHDIPFHALQVFDFYRGV